jgi:hypothetical protein
MNIQSLTEKYRPTKLSDCVLPNKTKSKLEKFRTEVIKFLSSKRSYIDPRTRGAIENKIYRASTINKLNNILVDLQEINNKTKKYKVSDIKNIAKERKTHEDFFFFQKC